ncbi:toll-Interleukin receptor [Flavobacteriaceae bacterium CRH]|nr:toll-Interleukin receptor [Flavobacteriaceae bacterium CRH]
MKVFISWSGERSKKVAELLDDWIQCVIQAVNPWMSSKDIDRGALWFTEINDQLANTSIGIVCLTKENRNKPWILFESGALAKGLTSNRVCTFLIDLSPTDLENPLAQFNHTFPVRESVWELVRTINISLKENALKESVLEKVFETYWVQFDHDFKKIIETTPETAVVTKRKDNDIMLDVLSTVRMLDRRMRNLESTTEKQFYTIENEPIRGGSVVSYQDLRNFINSLFEQEFPEEIILQLVGEKYKYPRSLIRREIERAKTIREVNDNK